MPYRRDVSLELSPASPFRLDLTAWALRRRTHNGLDSWDGPSRTYRRLLPVEDRIIPLSIIETGTIGRPGLRVEAGEPQDLQDGGTQAGVLGPAVSRLLGLEIDLVRRSSRPWSTRSPASKFHST